MYKICSTKWRILKNNREKVRGKLAESSDIAKPGKYNFQKEYKIEILIRNHYKSSCVFLLVINTNEPNLTKIKKIK